MIRDFKGIWGKKKSSAFAQLVPLGAGRFSLQISCWFVLCFDITRRIVDI